LTDLRSRIALWTKDVTEADMKDPVKTVGIGWYDRDAYPRILEDAETLPDSYDDWARIAKATERTISAEGIKVVRAVIEPDQFKIWCKAEGLRCNVKARMRWSGEFASRTSAGDN
jgi:hypothetical protein